MTDPRPFALVRAETIAARRADNVRLENMDAADLQDVIGAREDETRASIKRMQGEVEASRASALADNEVEE